MVDAPDGTEALVESLEKHGAEREATLSDSQVAADNSLLALQVNGVDLSPDHGYPARIIIPGAPGVHQTKWVTSIAFGEA
jgi:DMSO/TMAO reductase YedYZ molybdopterin-dependent catalytic subunit